MADPILPILIGLRRVCGLPFHNAARPLTDEGKHSLPISLVEDFMPITRIELKRHIAMPRLFEIPVNLPHTLSIIAHRIHLTGDEQDRERIGHFLIPFRRRHMLEQAEQIAVTRRGK